MHTTYVGADSSKVLTKGITNYSEIKNIISLNDDANKFVYSSELQVHILYGPRPWTS